MQLFLVNYDTHYEIEQLSRMFFRGLTVTKTDSMPQLPDSEYILIENKGGSFDISICLRSTPEETKAYRLFRARDTGADSPFVTMVLEIEQAELDSRAPFAKIIISKSGEIIDPKPLLESFFGKQPGGK